MKALKVLVLRIATSRFFANRYVRIGLVVLFYFFAFFLFVRLTFPYDAVRDRLTSEYNSMQKERRLELEEVGGHGFFGIEAEGVRLVSLAAPGLSVPAEPAEAKKEPKALTIDALRISPSLLSYIFGKIAVDFEADIGGGTLEGTFEQDDEHAHIALVGEEIDITGLALLEDAVGLPLGGVLTMNAEIDLPEGNSSKAEGKVELSISELSVGDGKAKVRNTIALPKLNAGDLNLIATVTAGRMEVSEFSANGPDFEMNGGGKVRLREPFEKSALDLELGFKFKDAYVTKSDMTKSIFGSPDGKVPGLFDMDPQVRQSKGEDKFYRWRVGGFMTRPTFRPGGGSKRAVAKDRK